MFVKQLLKSSDAFLNCVMSDLDNRYLKINNKYIVKNKTLDKKRNLNEIFMPSFIRDLCHVTLDSTIEVTEYDISKIDVLSAVVFNIRILGNPAGYYNVILDGKDITSMLHGLIVNNVGQRFALLTKCDIKIVATVTETSGVGVVDSESVIVEAGAGIKKIKNLRNTNMSFKLETDYKKLGVGGLNDEFIKIFRRAFISRIMPDDTAKKLGVKHVRGLIMYGPPGCGKTLTARTISKMLHCSSEPKIISGPEIFNKYVGESERKVRELFKDAEDNPNDFHVIIIDEIDAMCRKRGSGDDSGGSRVNDSIVNQLLAKIDGVNSIDNILLIGMTNRLDMMDKALLRPGRFEVQIEVGLPDKKGRKEILTIHTKTMTDGGVLDENVNIDKLATHTKNFTGAEIEGLVKSAVSFATQRHVDNDDMSKLHDIENIMVMESDFDSALGEVTPAFGLANEHELAVLLGNGVIDTWKAFQVFEEKLKASIFNRIQTTKSILLHGQRGCGKTALIARIGLEYNIPFVKLIKMESLITMSESERINEINSIFNDSKRSENSIILIDDIERIIEYVDIGPRFSNQLLQCMLVMINMATENNLTIVVTSSLDIRIIDALGFCFDDAFEIPLPTTREDKHEIVSITKTNLVMDDDLPIPIKRFYS